jgi:hypothetical protein
VLLQAAQLHPLQRDGVGPRRDDGVDGVVNNLFMARQQDRLEILEQSILKLDAVAVSEVGDDIVAETRMV